MDSPIFSNIKIIDTRKCYSYTRYKFRVLINYPLPRTVSVKRIEKIPHLKKTVAIKQLKVRSSRLEMTAVSICVVKIRVTTLHRNKAHLSLFYGPFCI